jgi:hypothetical protein
VDADTIAEPRPCTRCTQPCLLSVVGRCATCMADMYFHHTDEYRVWKVEVAAYGTKSS